MRTEELFGVVVSDTEYHTVGLAGITSIEWGYTSGLHWDLDTIRVFKNGKLRSEHPFTSCKGVYFK